MILNLPFEHLLFAVAKISFVFVEVGVCGWDVVWPVLGVEILDGLGAEEHFFAGETEGFYFGADGCPVGGRVSGEVGFDLAFIDHIYDGYGSGRLKLLRYPDSSPYLPIYPSTQSPRRFTILKYSDAV